MDHPSPNLKTAEWVETHEHYGEPPHTRTLHWWLRLDPPAVAWRTDLGSHDVMDERGHLHTHASRESCLLLPHGSPWSREIAMGHVLGPSLSSDIGRWET